MTTHTDHILVVDDDADIRQLVGDYLRRNGLRVSQAADGREMRATLETSDVDLIVLDVMMPGEDGLSLCRNLRAGKHRAVPVVMLTARDDETDRIIGLEMGADDYVVKPFSSRELLARITAVIRRTRMLPPNLQVSEAARLIQGRDAELFDRSIDLLVSRLRQRLGDGAREQTFIKTVRSEGYVFSQPVVLLHEDA